MDEKIDLSKGPAENWDEEVLLGVDAQLVLNGFRSDRPGNAYPKINIITVFYLGVAILDNSDRLLK